jgi:hypothetical protein
MGHDEPVTPVFPNSDAYVGVVGSAAVMLALVERFEKGGSFTLDLSLDAYNARFLVQKSAPTHQLLGTSFGRNTTNFPSGTFRTMLSRHH